MTPASRLRADIQSLLEKLEFERDTRRKLAGEIASHATPADPGKPAAALVALDLDHYYTSVESTLEAVARVMDGDAPAGNGWHRLLLDAMAAEGQTRPAVISGETNERLRKLLGFRHFLRHAYAVELDWNKLAPLALDLDGLESVLNRDLTEFRSFLEGCLAAGDVD